MQRNDNIKEKKSYFFEHIYGRKIDKKIYSLALNAE